MSGQAYLVSERHLQARILEAARALRYSCYHTFDSRRSAPGFPDLVMARPPRLIFAELKSEKGKLTLDQERWLELLGAVPGVEVVVWRPQDLQEAILYLR